MKVKDGIEFSFGIEFLRNFWGGVYGVDIDVGFFEDNL